MNIMLCGAASFFSAQVARSLAEQGNRVCQLTGATVADKLDLPISNQIDLAYTSPQTVHAFCRFLPDVVVIMGAFDRAYDWEFFQKDAVEFQSGVAALLSAARACGARKVVYLSSIEVYEANTERKITRQTEPVTTSEQKEVLLRVERMCTDFSDNLMEVNVVRLPEVFGEYEANAYGDFCLRKTLEYLRDGKATYVPDARHCALHYEDAASIVSNVIMADRDTCEPLMQFTGYVFSEERLAELLLNTGCNDKAIKQSSDARAQALPALRVIDVQDDLLGIYPRRTFSEAIAALCRSCAQAQVGPGEPSYKRWIPCIESAALLLLAHFATAAVAGADWGFVFCFYLAYALIMGAACGLKHGLATVPLSAASAFLAFGGAAALQGEGMLPAFCLGIAEVAMAGGIAGFAGEKRRIASSHADQSRNAAKQISGIASDNTGSFSVKDLYEKRIMGYEGALARIYELTARLDCMTSQKVIFEAVSVVRSIMEMDSVAIYLAGRDTDYFRLSAASTARARYCGKSLKLDDSSFLFDAVSVGQVYSNRDVSDPLPTFATAVQLEGEVVGLVMCWADQPEQTQLGADSTLELLCQLIAHSIGRARAYEEALRSRSCVEGTRIMLEEPFFELLSIFAEGRARGLLSYRVLELEMDGLPLETAEYAIRKTDSIGLVQGKPHIVLANAEPGDEVHVINRLRLRGVFADVVDDQEMLESHHGRSLIGG